MTTSTTIADLTFTIARDGDLVTGAVEFPECFHRRPVQIYYRSQRPDKQVAAEQLDARTAHRVRAAERYLQLREANPDTPKGIHFGQVAREFDAALRSVQLWVQKYERSGPAATIDTPMMHSAAGLVARGIPLADILATIDCYYAWPCDRGRYPFKPFSRWARHDFETWLFRAADDADYRRAVADSQADPVPLRGVDPDSVAKLDRPRVPSSRTRKRDVHNRATRATIRSLTESESSPPPLSPSVPSSLTEALQLLPDQYRTMLFSAARGDRHARATAIATIQVWWFPVFDPDARDGVDPYGTDPADLNDPRWHRPKVVGFLNNLRDHRGREFNALAVAARLPA